jgi:uncharacterized membrane protein
MPSASLSYGHEAAAVEETLAYIVQRYKWRNLWRMNEALSAAHTVLLFTPVGESGNAFLSISYDSVLAWVLHTLIFLANMAGGLVVGVATVRGILLYATDLIRNRGGEVPKEGIRLSLGRSLALALEFQVGADILGTALNPSWRDVEVLGAIVILRTVLNFFLQRELREAAKREAEAVATIAGEHPEQAPAEERKLSA